jgi:hypothetical protein
VTNPEQYRPLHGLARDLLDCLTADYAVERVEGLSIDEQLHHGVPVDRVVRLTPPAGAPLTIAFTLFPGLIVRYGRWSVAAYPVCGCDACDEGLDDLTEEFTAHVQDLVGGAFREEVTWSGWLRHQLGESPGGRRRLSKGDPALSKPGAVTGRHGRGRSSDPQRITPL